GGATYNLTLRSGLKFPDGSPVVASDFTFAIERAIKLNWCDDSFFTENIAGAATYQSGKASTISGITTDDSSGKIVIQLVKPDGSFSNVLALFGAAPLPPSTPMSPQSTTPPLGVGAYQITSVTPNVSFTLKKVSGFASFHLPGIPTGFVNEVQVQDTTN